MTSILRPLKTRTQKTGIRIGVHVTSFTQWTVNIGGAMHVAWTNFRAKSRVPKTRIGHSTRMRRSGSNIAMFSLIHGYITKNVRFTANSAAAKRYLSDHGEIPRSHRKAVTDHFNDISSRYRKLGSACRSAQEVLDDVLEISGDKQKIQKAFLIAWRIALVKTIYVEDGAIVLQHEHNTERSLSIALAMIEFYQYAPLTFSGATPSRSQLHETTVEIMRFITSQREAHARHSGNGACHDEKAALREAMNVKSHTDVESLSLLRRRWMKMVHPDTHGEKSTHKTSLVNAIIDEALAKLRN